MIDLLDLITLAIYTKLHRLRGCFKTHCNRDLSFNSVYNTNPMFLINKDLTDYAQQISLQFVYCLL